MSILPYDPDFVWIIVEGELEITDYKNDRSKVLIISTPMCGGSAYMRQFLSLINDLTIAGLRTELVDNEIICTPITHEEIHGVPLKSRAEEVGELLSKAIESTRTPHPDTDEPPPRQRKSKRRNKRNWNKQFIGGK